MNENKMPGLLEAKRVLVGGTGVVLAVSCPAPDASAAIIGCRLTSFRIVQIRREEGDYYGKALADGRWYPIRSIEVQR